MPDRRPPLSPQLAWRVAVLGALALAAFASLALRLWSLQVLSGDRFVALAQDNGRRELTIEAPRGDIVDRHGAKLVTTRRAAVVQITPSALPQAVRDQAAAYRGGPVPPASLPLYRRLGRVLALRPRTIQARVVRALAQAPYANITIRTDVPRTEFDYLRERPELFGGVVVTDTFLRDYPHGALAAALFGTVSQGRGVSGLEQHYDDVLRGRDGVSRLTVDADGQRDERIPPRVTEPQQGERLKLTLDLGLQRAGDAALSRALRASKYPTRAGAWVALDPRDGAVLGMGSAPSFDASRLARPFSERTYRALTSAAQDAPLLNRATEAGYPTGSTFKPFTATAALAGGLIGPGDVYDDTGGYDLGTQHYRNAGGASFGPLDVADALKVSSDVFFFRLGADADSHGDLIQRWARRFGFGAKTGIDLPGEAPGLVPDAAWRTHGYRAYLACVRKAHLEAGTTAALYRCGGIDRPWTPGDDANLAVGQGDLQATPLQLAVAYAALANGGTIVRPHLGAEVEDGHGFELRRLPARPRRRIALPDRDVVLDGLRRAANEPGGTSADVFKGWPRRLTVYGKTGTAERGTNPDQAWYACFVNDARRPIVVVVTVERGGFGAETAAPAARLILSKWFGIKDTAFHSGSSATL